MPVVANSIVTDDAPPSVAAAAGTSCAFSPRLWRRPCALAPPRVLLQSSCTAREPHRHVQQVEHTLAQLPRPLRHSSRRAAMDGAGTQVLQSGSAGRGRLVM